MGELKNILPNLCQTRTRRLTLVLGMLACAVLVFHTFTLPSTNLSPPTFPTTMIAALRKRILPNNGTSAGSLRVGEFSLLSDSKNSTPEVLEEVVDAKASDDDDDERETKHIDKIEETEQELEDDSDDGSDLDNDDTNPDNEFSFNLGGGVILKKVRDPVGGFITLVKVNVSEDGSSAKNIKKMVEGTYEEIALKEAPSVASGVSDQPDVNGSSSNGLLPSSHADTVSPAISSDVSQKEQMIDMNPSSFAENVPSNVSHLDEPTKETLLETGSLKLSQQNFTGSNNNSMSRLPTLKKKRPAMPPLSIAEMNNLLLKNRASYRTMRPRSSSAKDQQILAIRSQISSPPIVKGDKELHVPAFRNLSMFKRSYELMEKTLKVYVYREGEKPIFHQPLLKGIYASEGWFMKLMEGNKRFVVKDPRKAHLFYMPFSSRFLEFSLYVPNSHNRTNLRVFLKNYVDLIAAKYPFWNRTGGTDHFLVACHDWAPFETLHTMDRCVRALCNADLSHDFRLGKDVSLPETYVRFGRDPLRDLGGKPAKERDIFAFYAGNMHGYLRTILLEHWENKDPDMKILGPMPPGVQSKMNYIQLMKSSKYCICPRGYEVNSPRVVESIFYECVPVIISDNYVPPFFEVLNWEAFAVFVPEADIPRLKDILLAIPEEKYLSLQMGVKKVQRHFLWHPKAVKYDLFHMTLHSIWYNRVFTLKPR